MGDKEALKPCPFCGGTDLQVSRNIIICKNWKCGAEGPDIGDWGGPDADAKRALYFAWNFRPVAIAEREGLERRLERLLRSTRGDEGGIWPLEVRDAIDALEEEHGIFLCSSSFAAKHDRLREAAESKLSALETAMGRIAGLKNSVGLGPARAIAERALLHPTVPVERKAVRAMGSSLTEAVIERDHYHINLTWIVRGQQHRRRIYEPQMMEMCPALADVLVAAVEARALSVAPPSQGMETLVENANARIAKVWDLEEKGTCSLGTLQVARSDRDRALIALGRQALAALQSHKGGEAPLAEPSDPR